MLQYLLFIAALIFIKLGDLHNLRKNTTMSYEVERDYYYNISKILFIMYIMIII